MHNDGINVMYIDAEICPYVTVFAVGQNKSNSPALGDPVSWDTNMIFHYA